MNDRLGLNRGFDRTDALILSLVYGITTASETSAAIPTNFSTQLKRMEPPVGRLSEVGIRPLAQHQAIAPG